VTRKGQGQGRGPEMFDVQYLGNRAR